MERPIIFSADSVRAILDGRKTQTRRVVRPSQQRYDVPPWNVDRLWVREQVRAEELPSGLDGVRYRADNAFIPIENSESAADKWLDLWHYRRAPNRVHDHPGNWVPPIHMPRWASRITLAVQSARVECLQGISDDDINAEAYDSRDAFVAAWDKLNAKRGLRWADNPWVWVIEFSVHEFRR